jgi:hypothetical protein
MNDQNIKEQQTQVQIKDEQLGEKARKKSANSGELETGLAICTHNDQSQQQTLS